jgi:hypothetical protein
MINIEDVLLNAVAQAGDRYEFGAAVNFNNPDPEVFDCSGLVQWSCHQARVGPAMPRGSWIQATHCHTHNTEISVEDAIKTRGALLFRFDSDPFTASTRPSKAHVAWSLGDGTTIEAASAKWGVGSFTADPRVREWTHAALIPGVDYASRPSIFDPKAHTNPTTESEPQTETEEEDEVTRVAYYLGPDGAVHTYAVAGLIGKHLSPAALNLYQFVETPVVGSPTKPLGKEWQDGVALLDGPLRNIS